MVNILVFHFNRLAMNVGPQLNAYAGGVRFRGNPSSRYYGRHTMVPYNNRRTRIRRYRRRIVSRVPRNLNLPLISTQGSIVTADATNVILQYNTGFTLTIGGTGSAVYNFAANGLYDPDVTGVGSQPNGYDDYANFYNRYKVTASSISVRFRQAANSELGVMLVWPSLLVASNATSFANDLGNPYVKEQAIPTFEGGYVGKIRSYISMTKLFGVTNPGEFSDTDFAAPINANPVKLGYWGIKASTFNGQAPVTGNTIEVIVKVTYYATFYERKPQGRS